MIDRELAEIVVALALILTCALSAIATAQPVREQPSPRVARKERRADRRRAPPEHVTADVPVVTPVVETASAFTPSPSRARPRILTGEPAEPEPSRPAARRAITLVGGIAVLAAGGAVGLLVLVRTLVAMFKRIGG